MVNRLVVVVCLLLGACSGFVSRETPLSRIETIVVIYAENHSFDNLYGMFPGADGVANATAEQKTQVDHDGKPLAKLPPVWAGTKPDPRYPHDLPNGPFQINAPPTNARFDEVVPSPIHNFWHNKEQINGGKNNMFVAMGTAGAWTMGYYDTSSLRLWKFAQRYTLADKFFMGAFGGSFLNHQWLICACAPAFPTAPASIRAQLDASGKLKKRPGSPASIMQGPVQVFDGPISPDGFALNTAQPPYQPSGIAPAKGGSLDLADPAKNPIPPQTAKTIGDTLSAKGITWAWYGGAYNQALADGRRDPEAKRAVIYNRDATSPNFQPHHQPFNYFARFAPGTKDRAEHLRDGEDFVAAIDAGKLPQVAIYKPTGRLNQHPSYTDILSGDTHIADLLAKLEKSPQWPGMVVILTYDENGGYWDHVPPPTGPGLSDAYGPGTRIPTLIISPFAKRGHVDHTSYDTTSILKLITRRFGLESLPGIREKAGDLTPALNLQ